MKVRYELMSMLNSSIVLAIPHLTPAILKLTYATYLGLYPFD